MRPYHFALTSLMTPTNSILLVQAPKGDTLAMLSTSSLVPALLWV